MGEFAWLNAFGIGQAAGFSSTFLYHDYLIGCSFQHQRCKVWNYTSLQPIGFFRSNLYLASSQLLESKGIYIFGTNTGNLVYLNLSTLPNSTYNFVNNVTNTSWVRVKKSSDQVYLAVTYSSLDILKIFNLSDWSLVRTISLPTANWISIWSFDSRYLIILPFHHNYILVYDRFSNWQLVNNVTIGYTNVRNCIPHEETNSYLCIGGTNLEIFSLNLIDFSVSFVLNGFQGTKLKASENYEVFVIYSNHNIPTLFYQFNKYCRYNTFFHTTQKVCVVCDTNCVECLSTTACKDCLTNYTLIQGICQPCSSNELYNRSTKLCDDVTDFCSGDQYFSIPLLTCVQCQKNCAKCSSTSSCQSCSVNFSLLDGSCQPCGSNELYNRSTELCDDITTFCHGDNFFSKPLLQCVQCQPFCQRCVSADSCIVCIRGYYLIDRKCLLQNTLTLNQKSTVIQILQSPAMEIMNKIPANRIVIRQVFAFFINIDHLWLYIYHKRDYGQFTSDLFKAIKKLETQKWNLFVDAFFNYEFKKALQEFINLKDFKLSQGSRKFFDIQNNSSSFFVNNFYFLCFNVPLVVLIFLLFRFCFYLFFNYRISLFFRKYTFKLFLVCLLMEGNIESFSYCFLFDGKHLNSQNYLQKGVNLLILLLFAFFFELVVSWFWIIKFVEKNNTKYFLDNFHTNVRSLLHVTFTNGLFNFLLGVCHIMIEDAYEYQLMALTFVEVGFMIVQIGSLRVKKIYQLKYMGWQNMMASFLRVLLILTFSIDKDIDHSSDNLYNQIQQFILSLYFLNWMISIILGFTTLFFESGKLIIVNYCVCIADTALLNQSIKEKHSYSNKKIEKGDNFVDAFQGLQLNSNLTLNRKAQIIKYEILLVEQNGEDQQHANQLLQISKMSVCNKKNQQNRGENCKQQIESKISERRKTQTINVQKQTNTQKFGIYQNSLAEKMKKKQQIINLISKKKEKKIQQVRLKRLIITPNNDLAKSEQKDNYNQELGFQQSIFLQKNNIEKDD